MTAIAQYKSRTYQGHTVKYVDPKIWKENKKPIFRWADNEAARKGYNPQVTNLLKTIICLTDINNKTIATIPTIIKKLNSKYPNSTKSKRTIHRYLAILEKGKSIKRGKQLGFNSPCPTKVLATKSVNSSVTECHTKFLYNKNTSLYHGPKLCLDPSQDPDYLASFDRILARDKALGIW